VESKLAGVQAIYEQLQGLDKSRLRDVLPTLYRDKPLLTESLQKEVDARQQLVRLPTTLADDHPDVKGVRQLLTRVSEDVDKRINGILVALRMQVESGEVVPDRGEGGAGEGERIFRSQQYQPYFLKKRELENEKIMLDVLARKLAAETFEQSRSRVSPW
jgi:hypothetical protein